MVFENNNNKIEINKNDDNSDIETRTLKIEPFFNQNSQNIKNRSERLHP